MAIDPKEINAIESSMVHDVEDDPKPEGLGIYLTLRFLSKVMLGVYGIMLLGMLMLQMLLSRGQAIPVFLMPQSVLLALPFALGAVYFYFDSDEDVESARQRTVIGRAVTFVVVFVVMQVVSILLWVGLARAFSLH